MIIEKKNATPFVLSGIIVLLDQLTKYFIATNIKLHTIGAKIFGDFLWIVHERNTGAAFSLAYSASVNFRIIFLIILPLAVLLTLAWSILTAKDYTPLQRWAVAAIIGGGMGNIIDRILRNITVFDFISVMFYGILGFERWPTFNVADSAVVIGGIILLMSLIITALKKEK